MSALSRKLDGLAISCSAICLVHCLLLPVAVALLPLAGLEMSHASFHQLLLVVILPTSVLALGMGCRRHGLGHIAGFGGVGLGLLIFAALAVDSLWGHTMERPITIAGGLFLALAHVQNFRACRAADCAQDCH
ncbi:MAG: MerC domain-containing protein [Salinisphaera sp.]|nr:MerC domain-containing protein [Salinisphaera sp.]MDN5938856.1 MerC domain-containing protein [Salinisphaera sp.]